MGLPCAEIIKLAPEGGIGQHAPGFVDANHLRMRATAIRVALLGLRAIGRPNFCKAGRG